jgi:O-antigen ligase
MSGELVEVATAPAIEGSSERAPSLALRLAAILPGLSTAVLVAAVGVSHGGYFATAWGPLTLVFLGVSAAALLVRPRPALGLRELLVPGLLAAITLWALVSSAWGSPTEAVPEAQRALAYTAAAFAFALVLRRERVAGILVGVWLGICAVGVDALAGRLFPERFGEYDSISGYRLSEPVGYWNALGVLMALGLVLAFSFAARPERLPLRLVAAASTVPLALTLYFTFSRGAWLALAAGLTFALVVDPRRLRLTVTLLLVAPWPALAVWLASTSGPLTQTGYTLASASRDAHALAAIGAGLAFVAAACAAFAAAVGPRVHVSRRAGRVANAGLAAALVGAAVLVVAALGGPSQIARSFAAAPRATDGDLNERLFDLSGSGRVDGWRVALDDAEEHPLVGSGGGSYKRYWLEHRPYAASIRDAHSLYLESLAEYGPLGLILVVGVVAVPLGLAVRLRRRPLVPAAAGVVVVYAVHASVDWDWEFPILTVVALACAAAIMASGEPRAPAAMRFERRRLLLLAVVLALVPVATVGALGARAAAASAEAARDKDYGRAAEEARSAERLTPWSAEPLLLLGRAQAAAGNDAAARATFARALRREPRSWRLWYELAAVSRGVERRAALREARALNPLESLLDDLAEGP